MALSIKHPEADRLARELARRKRQSITEVIVSALREELDREKSRVRAPGIAERLQAVGRRYNALPVLDHRPDDEILGYDDLGVPR